MTLTCIKDKLYLFGGSGPNAACFKDLQVLDTSTMTWLVVHARATGSDVGNVDTQDNPNRDCSGTDLTIFGTGPSARAGHTANVINRRLLIYGGSRGDSYVGDIFMLDTDRQPTIKISSENFLAVSCWFH